jgi:hypothetical protein
MNMKIYLAGKVPKGDEEQKTFNNWREHYSQTLRKHFPDAEIIDPYSKHTDEADYIRVVGSDSRHIKECSFVIVNAEDRLGVGTSQEMVIAKYFKKPVVTVLPQNTTHRRSNIKYFGKMIEDWIHPFIHTFSDFIIKDISEIFRIKDRIFTDKIKDITIIDKAVDYAK